MAPEKAERKPDTATQPPRPHTDKQERRANGRGAAGRPVFESRKPAPGEKIIDVCWVSFVFLTKGSQKSPSISLFTSLFRGRPPALPRPGASRRRTRSGARSARAASERSRRDPRGVSLQGGGFRFHGFPLYSCNMFSLKLLEKRLIRRPFQETPLGSLRIAISATSINVQPLRLQTDTGTGSILRDIVNFASEHCGVRCCETLQSSSSRNIAETLQSSGEDSRRLAKSSPRPGVRPQAQGLRIYGSGRFGDSEGS